MNQDLAQKIAEYKKLSPAELQSRILAVKSRLGKKLLILGHHYQTDEVIALADHRGDSFKLSKTASEEKLAEFIVFCGVHFMAESAAILASPGQEVFLPEMSAGCPMADMAFISQVEQAWDMLGRLTDIDRVAPVVYVNSEAELKAFCGKNHGACCTSSNADKIFKWAFAKAEKIFFFPDEHLGRNTAFKLGLTEKDLLVYDPADKFAEISKQRVQAAKLILWKGYCHVHTFFRPEHVKASREKYPGAKIIVHPETPAEVVELADAAASTEGIIRYVESQPEGTTIVVGTEIHLVERLAKEQKGKRQVFPLARSACPNMSKINLANLLLTLEHIEMGPKHWLNRITVPEPLRSQARLALKRMLENA